MTFNDMMTVEACVAELVPTGEERPPVMRTLTYDRVEIDLSHWEVPHRTAMRDQLAKGLAKAGHPEWEAWFAGNSTEVLFVSEKEEP
jgi:hypothetical protein